MVEIITTTRGDSKGEIDYLISHLEQAKKMGATHYNMRWSGDRMWAFKWFETYRNKSQEEIKQEKVKALEKQLQELKK